MKRMEKGDKLSVLFGTGALASGVAASFCCLGPIVFAALGLGSFGLAASVDRARPVLALVLVVLAGAGLYFAHRKREVACEDGTCRMEGAGKGVKALLWLLVLASGALYFVPYFL